MSAQGSQYSNPHYYQGQQFQPPFMQRPPDTGRGMAIAALVCFIVAWVCGVAAFIPLLGLAFLCVGLIVHILGFVFLGIAIARWPH